jgi:hypothetical protein
VHYVGNREKLLAALVEHVTEQYRCDLKALAVKLPQRRRMQAVLQCLFGDFLDRPEEDAVIGGLLAVMATNPGMPVEDVGVL